MMPAQRNAETMHERIPEQAEAPLCGVMGFACVSGYQCPVDRSCEFFRFEHELREAIESNTGQARADLRAALDLVRRQHASATALVAMLETSAPDGIAFDAVLSEYGSPPDTSALARGAGLSGRGWREDRETLLGMLRQLCSATDAVLAEGELDDRPGRRAREGQDVGLVDDVVFVFLRWYKKRQSGRGCSFRQDIATVVRYAFCVAGRQPPASFDGDARSKENEHVRGFADYIEPALKRARKRSEEYGRRPPLGPSLPAAGK